MGMKACGEVIVDTLVRCKKRETESYKKQIIIKKPAEPLIGLVASWPLRERDSPYLLSESSTDFFPPLKVRADWLSSCKKKTVAHISDFGVS